jgi:hypothetical protein
MTKRATFEIAAAVGHEPGIHPPRGLVVAGNTTGPVVGTRCTGSTDVTGPAVRVRP